MRQLLSDATVDAFPLPTSQDSPASIVAGPDGNLWFTEDAAKVGRITPQGQFAEFTVPTPRGGSTPDPSDIVDDIEVAASDTSFGVVGDHNYADTGACTIHVTIVDDAGHTAIAATPAQVGSSPFVLRPGPVSTTTAPVQDQDDLASLFDFRGTSPSLTYTATVDCGDGSAPTSRLVQPIRLAYSNIGAQASDPVLAEVARSELLGTHVYAATGSYTISYTVTDSDGNSHQATSTAQVTGAQAGAIEDWPASGTVIAAGDSTAPA